MATTKYASKGQIMEIMGDVATKTATALSGKQNTLTFDSVPTDNSGNPVTSGGVKQYVDGLILSAINNSY